MGCARNLQAEDRMLKGDDHLPVAERVLLRCGGLYERYLVRCLNVFNSIELR